MPTKPDLRTQRIAAQRLAPHTLADDVGILVQDILAIQAQDYRAAALSIRARTNGLTVDDVRIALEETRAIILTWCMRGTMHFLPASDAGWLMDIVGPVFIKKTKSRYKQLGLSEDIRQRALTVIQQILSQRGPTSRPEMRNLLAEKDVPTEGQTFIHLMRFAALRGAVCFGPEIDGEQSFALLSDWINLGDHPPNPPAELARRYLHAYAPATVDDFARWSGLSLKIARVGFDALADEDISSEDATDSPFVPVVRLLPAFDTLLLGYASREWLIDAENEPRIHPGGGIIKPSVLVGGRIVGVWSFQKGGRVIQVEGFDSLARALIPKIEAEVADIGRFLGTDIRLEIL